MLASATPATTLRSLVRAVPGYVVADIGQQMGLAGYLLLDYRDEFAISRVGLYLSRHGATITWDAGEFLRLLGSARPLPELRSLLRRHLTACRARSRSTDAYRIAAHSSAPARVT